jgi:hypothetical protein
MILRFRLSNFRSFRDETELSLVATSLDDGDSIAVTVGDDARQLDVVPIAGIFGANASGKSNLLKGLAFMRMAVDISHRRWDPNQPIPRDAFCLNRTSEQLPTMFDLDFVIDAQRYQYGFEFDDDKFLSEWLYAYPKGRTRLLFERDGNDIRFGTHLVGNNKSSQEILRPNSLFLSAAATANHSGLSPIFTWFRNGISIRQEPRPDSPAQQRRATSLLKKQDHRFQDLMRHADLGIEGIEIETSAMAADRIKGIERVLRAVIDPHDPDRKEREKKLLEDLHDAEEETIHLLHRTIDGGKAIDFDDESVGTQTWFNLVGLMLHALDTAQSVFIDEFDANLHPTLMAQALKIFRDPKINTKGAQLIFTAHDTTPLGSMVSGLPLGRDQIWLSEKDAEGCSHLISLSDFRPRRGENIQRGYLQGRYGGTPTIPWLILAESLVDSSSSNG